ncbi:pre-mRNA cleavage complex 2 protein Pcf11 [Protopterus annectens]|uniref:pre-mRNA cleavage complex 2 protein Pcf11 n=1 Tax=Protopterus annectens TaxID=7888 RepID=UPI001CFB43F5|nr:pre-mRNA cleavage complex 2 protein Pcf11 [Protopterus annectens]
MSEDDGRADACREYQSSLEDLTFNSKPHINMLTILAEENLQFYKDIVSLIEAQIAKAPAAEKLPVMYLTDSIVKNVGREYLTAFTKNLVSTFVSVFEKVDENTRKSLYKLRSTWDEIFPLKKLYALDVRVNTLDPAWPIKPLPPNINTSIHVNPKFLNKTPEENVPATVASGGASGSEVQKSLTQEQVIRQQLLAKQKQLLELQQKKLELELEQTKAQLAASLGAQQVSSTNLTGSVLPPRLPNVSSQSSSCKVQNLPASTKSQNVTSVASSSMQSSPVPASAVVKPQIRGQVDTENKLTAQSQDVKVTTRDPRLNRSGQQSSHSHDRSPKREVQMGRSSQLPSPLDGHSPRREIPLTVHMQSEKGSKNLEEKQAASKQEKMNCEKSVKRDMHISEERGKFSCKLQSPLKNKFSTKDVKNQNLESRAADKRDPRVKKHIQDRADEKDEIKDKKRSTEKREKSEHEKMADHRLIGNRSRLSNGLVTKQEICTNLEKPIAKSGGASSRKRSRSRSPRSRSPIGHSPNKRRDRRSPRGLHKSLSPSPKPGKLRQAGFKSHIEDFGQHIREDRSPVKKGPNKPDVRETRRLKRLQEERAQDSVSVHAVLESKEDVGDWQDKYGRRWKPGWVSKSLPKSDEHQAKPAHLRHRDVWAINKGVQSPRTPKQPRFSVDPNLQIPKELTLANKRELLMKANEQLNSGEITPEEFFVVAHQLRQLSLYERQRSECEEDDDASKPKRKEPLLSDAELTYYEHKAKLRRTQVQHPPPKLDLVGGLDDCRNTEALHRIQEIDQNPGSQSVIEGPAFESFEQCSEGARTHSPVLSSSSFGDSVAVDEQKQDDLSRTVMASSVYDEDPDNWDNIKGENRDLCRQDRTTAPEYHKSNRNEDGFHMYESLEKSMQKYAQAGERDEQRTLCDVPCTRKRSPFEESDGSHIGNPSREQSPRKDEEGLFEGSSYLSELGFEGQHSQKVTLRKEGSPDPQTELLLEVKPNENVAHLKETSSKSSALWQDLSKDQNVLQHLEGPSNHLGSLQEEGQTSQQERKLEGPCSQLGAQRLEELPGKQDTHLEGPPGQHAAQHLEGHSSQSVQCLEGSVQRLERPPGPLGSLRLEGPPGQHGQFERPPNQHGVTFDQLSSQQGIPHFDRPVGQQGNSWLEGPPGHQGTSKFEGSHGQQGVPKYDGHPGQQGPPQFEGPQGHQSAVFDRPPGQQGASQFDRPPGQQVAPRFDGPVGQQGAPRFDVPPGQQGAPRFDVPPGQQGAPRFEVPPGQQGAPRFEVPPGQQGAPRFEVPPGQQGAPRFEVPPGQQGAPRFEVPPGPRFEVPPGQQGAPRFEVPPGQQGAPRFEVPPGQQGAPRFEVPPGQQGAPRFEVPPGQQGAPRFDGPPGQQCRPRFDGPPGQQCRPRFDGPSGQQGPPRFDGPPVQQCRPRFDGPPGQQGPPRFDGPPGQHGPPRFDGPQGPPRFDGPPGQQGPPRFNGPPGPPRFEGPPGQHAVHRFESTPGQQGPLHFEGRPGHPGGPRFDGLSGQHGAQRFEGPASQQGVQFEAYPVRVSNCPDMQGPLRFEGPSGQPGPRFDGHTISRFDCPPNQQAPLLQRYDGAPGQTIPRFEGPPGQHPPLRFEGSSVQQHPPRFDAALSLRFEGPPNQQTPSRFDTVPGQLGPRFDGLSSHLCPRLEAPPFSSFNTPAVQPGSMFADPHHTFRGPLPGLQFQRHETPPVPKFSGPPGPGVPSFRPPGNLFEEQNSRGHVFGNFSLPGGVPVGSMASSQPVSGVSQPVSFRQPLPFLPPPLQSSVPFIPNKTGHENHLGQLDVNALFAKLVSKGILQLSSAESASAKSSDASQVQPVEDEEEDDQNEDQDLPDLTSFTIEDLKQRYESVINRLYTGIQCYSCGMRFTSSQTDIYADHLDWHYRQNRTEKDVSRKVTHRRWYYSLTDWIEFEEIADLEERAKSQFFEKAHEEVIQKTQEAAKEKEFQSVPAGPAGVDEFCEICQEQFEQYWDEEEEEWHLKNAVRVEEKIYHPTCYEDYKKTSSFVESSPSPSPSKAPVENPLNAVLDIVKTDSQTQPQELLDDSKIKQEPDDNCSNCTEEKSSVDIIMEPELVKEEPS